MGILSLFKKKDDDDPPRRVSASGEPSRLALNSEADRARQREIARATAMKIDAIELAMTSDLFDERPGTGRKVPHQVQALPDADTLLLHDFPTTLLLTDEEMLAILPGNQDENVAEEAALVYANGDAGAARAMLEASIADGGKRDRQQWWMLFDLFLAGGDEAAFEQLSIAYAQAFETSPPAWHSLAPAAAATPAPGQRHEEVLPLALDASLAPLLARLAALPAVTLDVGGIMDVTPDGAELLLTHLRQHAHLALAGGEELVAVLRGRLTVGDKDAPTVLWMLLLEVLQRMNQPQAFDEAAMDYCVTYEISPPQFVAPAAGATAPRPAPRPLSDRFALQGELDGQPPDFSAHLATHGSLIFDCAGLRRIDYGAASDLLARLRPLAEEGVTIEFRALSHLVAALLRLLGVGQVAGLYPHKY